MELKNPAWLEIPTREGTFYGFTQTWYGSVFKRKAGCGPTAAAMQLLYMNKRDQGPLPYQSHDLSSATRMLEDVWKFVTPGLRGLDSTKKFVKGLRRHGLYYKTPWVCREFSVKRYGAVNKLEEIIAFVESGLASDCPVAFLNLHAGTVSAFDNWHWIVLTKLTAMDKGYQATAFDGGQKIEFDLGEWVKTTESGGGFVYLV